MKTAENFPYWHLLWQMTVAETKLRDQGTLLGFLWTLLHPALIFLVLYMLFIKWLGHLVNQYAAYLLIGLVLWNFFQKSTGYAIGSFKRNRAVVLNYRFPREIVVLSSVLAVFWTTLLEFCVLFLCLLLLGVRMHWAWLLLPVLLMILLALTIGLSLFLSVLAVEYQDMERIWEVLLVAMFYLTPVFYPISIISEHRQKILLLNPITQILTAARACLIQGELPRLSLLAGLLMLGGLIMAAGLATIRRCTYRLVDHLMV